MVRHVVNAGKTATFGVADEVFFRAGPKAAAQGFGREPCNLERRREMTGQVAVDVLPIESESGHEAGLCKSFAMSDAGG